MLLPMHHVLLLHLLLLVHGELVWLILYHWCIMEERWVSLKHITWGVGIAEHILVLVVGHFSLVLSMVFKND